MSDLATKAREYAELIDEIGELSRKRDEMENAENAAREKRRALEEALSGYVGPHVTRCAVYLGLRTVVIEWQSATSGAGIHLVDTVTA